MLIVLQAMDAGGQRRHLPISVTETSDTLSEALQPCATRACQADGLGPRETAVCRELTKLHEEIKRAPIDDLAKAAATLESLVAQDDSYALAHSALAVIYGRLRKHDDAIRHGLKVCELEPNDAFSFTAMSVTFQRAGKIPEAEEAMARARMIQARG